MHTAILIVDMLQDFFVDGRLLENKEKLTKNINELTSVARLNSFPVIWVRQEFKPDLSDAFLGIRNGKTKVVTIAGTDGSKLLPELKTDNNDQEVIKKRYSAFFNTNLKQLLDELTVDTLIICGVNTHACIRMAAIDAYQYDYNVILATDCVDSYDEEHHRVSMKYLTTVIASPKTNLELSKLLEG